MELLIAENISLKPYNTFGIDVRARYFVNIETEAHLAELFADPIVKANKILVIGGGSNILFTEDFEGLVVRVAIGGIAFEKEGSAVTVKAGGGVVWNDFVNYCVDHGFAGVENLSLIPGTVGASPVQNIGAYGVELKDVFLSCNAFNVHTCAMETFSAAECRFGYRDSIFKNGQKGNYIITSVTFSLSTTAKLHTGYGAIGDELARRGITEPDIRDISSVVSAIRVSKLPDPSTIGNAGSFFKNPVIDETIFHEIEQKFPEVVNYPAGAAKVKLAAGWMIEQCGFKGVVAGQTGTWKNQALVLVNHGGATGSEVYDFSEQIITSVRNKFGITLEREVNIF